MQSQPATSSDSAARVAVDLRRLPWMRRLATDYAFAFPSLAPFFAGDPAASTAWADAIARVGRVPRPRAAIAAMVAAQQAGRQAPAPSVAAAAHLAEAGTVAVVTGQQAGLFGGPLFTLLKAVTAIRLARQVTRDHGVPAVPIFWIDAEDHDWEEVRGCSVLDATLEPREIAAEPPEGAGTRTVGSLVWPDGIRTTVEALGAALPETAFTPWLMRLVADAYTPGRGVADAFGRLLEGVLGDHGLVVYDASDPVAKPFVASLFAAELEHAGRTSLLAARAGADLVARGYHMQVTPHAGHAALFDIEDGRRPLQVDGEHFVVGGDGTVPRRALVERARTHPSTFSPNVLLRPLTQDTIFPTVCYVAGPNELAYLAQLRGVYEAFGLPMPLMAPRATATLLDAAAMRFLAKQRVPLEALQARDEHALNELLRTLLPPSVEQALDSAGHEILARMDAVVASMPLVDPTLEGKARSVAGRMQHELETLRAKVLQAAKRRDETLRRQFLHAQAQAFPHGEPQERIVAGVSFLARYGPALIDRLLDELPVDFGAHTVLTV